MTNLVSVNESLTVARHSVNESWRETHRAHALHETRLDLKIRSHKSIQVDLGLASEVGFL